MSYHYFGPAT